MLDTGMSRWALSISMEVGEGGRQSGWGVMLLLTGGVLGLPAFPLAPVQQLPSTILSSTMDLQRVSPLVKHQ